MKVEEKRAFATIEEAQAALDAWVCHYNTERPHRGLALQTPIAHSDPVGMEGRVISRQRLGGLLRDYSRAPATVTA